MGDRLKRMLRTLIDGLTTALAITLIYVVLHLMRAAFGFWPTTIAGVTAIAVCLWVAAGEEDHG
ncbi:hypothetical protein [Paracoccus sp. J55]|uniref:hypothetical protein n=2 Tax=unclassified Paracoccus (in: a-proteobacteria) TaxID=2688777 RepID=UPI00048BEE31|nr:hypothetical protein [Paracoccus sp. J55]